MTLDCSPVSDFGLSEKMSTILDASEFKAMILYPSSLTNRMRLLSACAYLVLLNSKLMIRLVLPSEFATHSATIFAVLLLRYVLPPKELVWVLDSLRVAKVGKPALVHKVHTRNQVLVTWQVNRMWNEFDRVSCLIFYL